MAGDSGLGLLALLLVLFLSKSRKLSNGATTEVQHITYSTYATRIIDVEQYTEAREEAESLLEEIQTFRKTLPDAPPRPISTGKVRSFQLPPGGRIVLKAGPGPLPKGYVLPSPEPYVGLRPEIEEAIRSWEATKGRLAKTFPSIE